MRRYEDEQNGKLIKVICNQCRKDLKVENGYLKEGCFQGDMTFGYFSKRDGIRHQFDLCEECYERLIRQFTMPVKETQEKELL